MNERQIVPLPQEQVAIDDVKRLANIVLALLCRVGLHHYQPVDPFRDYWLTWHREHGRTPGNGRHINVR